MAETIITNFHFKVDWGGTRIGFEEVENLTIGIHVIEYRDGASKDYHTKKIPGRAYYENIVLRKGAATGDNEFFDWWNTIQASTVERRDITISLLNESHEPLVAWKISNAFPVKIVWTDLKATGNQVLIESLEIAHEGIKVEYT